ALERTGDQLGTAPRAMLERARDPRRYPRPGGDVGRPSVPPAAEIGHALRTAHVATPSRTSRTSVARNHARRNSPRPGFTGIHAQAERQMRRAASAVVRKSTGAPMTTHSLTSGLPSGTPSSRAVIATA